MRSLGKCGSAAGGDDSSPLFLCRVREGKDGKYLILDAAADSPDGERARYVIPVSVYEAIGYPIRGDLLGGERAQKVRDADEEMRAHRAAMDLLAYADNSERSLHRKLRQKGYSDRAAEDAVRAVVEDGFLSEERQLSRLIEREANERLYGPRKITARLYAKGYSAERIRKAIDEAVAQGAVNFRKNREKLIRKITPKLLETCESDEEFSEKKKTILYKYGYKAE